MSLLEDTDLPFQVVADLTHDTNDRYIFSVHPNQLQQPPSQVPAVTGDRGRLMFLEHRTQLGNGREGCDWLMSLRPCIYLAEQLGPSHHTELTPQMLCTIAYAGPSRDGDDTRDKNRTRVIQALKHALVQNPGSLQPVEWSVGEGGKQAFKSLEALTWSILWRHKGRDSSSYIFDNADPDHADASKKYARYLPAGYGCDTHDSQRVSLVQPTTVMGIEQVSDDGTSALSIIEFLQVPMSLNRPSAGDPPVLGTYSTTPIATRNTQDRPQTVGQTLSIRTNALARAQFAAVKMIDALRSRYNHTATQSDISKREPFLRGAVPFAVATQCEDFASEMKRGYETTGLFEGFRLSIISLPILNLTHMPLVDAEGELTNGATDYQSLPVGEEA